MHRFFVKVVLSGIFGISYCWAQQFQAGQWRNFTDMKSVRSVVFDSNRVLAATGGGLFAYEPTSGTFDRWTNSENLSSNDLTALMVDGAHRVWIGSSGGAIDVFDQSSNGWESIQDIAGSNRPQKSIHGFLAKGDTVYVVSDFGISVFLASRWEFGDTYASFGFSTLPSVTAMAVTGSQIFVGTDQGVAVAALSSANLSAPTSWTIYSTSQGLPAGSISSMATCHDTVLVGTPSGIYFFDGNSFQLLGGTSGRQVAAIVSTSNGFSYVSNSGGVFTVQSSSAVNGPVEVVASANSHVATSLAVASDVSGVAVGTSDDGVALWNGSVWTYAAPNGPGSNSFINLAVTTEGILWAGTGIDGGGHGFYRYDPSQATDRQWKNFTTANQPLMGSNDYYKVSLGDNGDVWISSWGYGVVKIVADTIQRKINGRSQPSFAPTIVPSKSTDPIFVVVGNAVVDASGDTWFDNYWATNGNYLATLINDSTFAYTRCTAIPCSGTFTSMVIDQNGTKWIANSEPTKKYPTGLYYYNENLSVAGTENTAGWGTLTTSDGLPNNTVLSLAVDQDNNVWVGTDLGVSIITDPQNPRGSIISSFPLREQSIQAIAVDGLNDKWIGTKEGVFVVNSDGTQLLNQYTVNNTGGKLVDNDVRSIAIDQQRGIAYFGTGNGLSSLEISAVQPLQSYATLQFGPNPYTLPNTEPLIIRNIVANSTVKILSVNGTLVAEFSAQGGGRAFWDGRDRRGNYVQTGIYFVVAYADNGNQVANGKVAVVRK